MPRSRRCRSTDTPRRAPPARSHSCRCASSAARALPRRSTRRRRAPVPRTRPTRGPWLSIGLPPRSPSVCVQRIIHSSMARRSQAQPSGLSRERILEVALELASAEGVEALSMRRLAQELDVWPMSVYRYFQDKDALLDAMASDLMAQLPELPASGSWRERMHDLLDEVSRRLADAPGLAVRLPRAFLAKGALRLPEAGIAILLDAGFPRAEAASAWRAPGGYHVGL